MRLFLAIPFPEDIKDRLYAGIQELKPFCAQGKFSPRNNLHLTLLFLGEVGPNALIRVKDSMAQLKMPAFSLQIGGLGRFRQESRDILWLGIRENPDLSRMYRQLHASLGAAGFALENRDFKPHLTLGRDVVLRGGVSMEAIGHSQPTVEVSVDGVSLMQSDQIQGKLVYTEIHHVRLQMPPEP